MSNSSRIRKTVTPTFWSGPTPDDVMKASGRSSVRIIFVSTGRGPRRELIVQVGEAFMNLSDQSVIFKGRTSDRKFAVDGRLDGTQHPVALATIERKLIPWEARKAS